MYSMSDEIIDAIMLAAKEVEHLQQELKRLQEVESIAAYIVLNRKNFTDKHPAVKAGAERILDELAAALVEQQPLPEPPGESEQT